MRAKSLPNIGAACLETNASLSALVVTSGSKSLRPTRAFGYGHPSCPCLAAVDGLHSGMEHSLKNRLDDLTMRLVAAVGVFWIAAAATQSEWLRQMMGGCALYAFAIIALVAIGARVERYREWRVSRRNHSC
jgi:hypothetical protein